MKEAVAKALERSPGSLRALAQEAGLSRSTLSRIQSGERVPNLAEVRALAEALARWEARCWEAERLLRKALQEQEKEQEKEKMRSAMRELGRLADLQSV
jgi:transcriptional regulator with XRE-family HTH domain